MRAIWVVLLVLGLAVAPALGVGQPDGYDCPVETDGVEEPGAELASVVGAQESVVARELERRGFNATLANATSPDERATVVATEVDRIEARLVALETCREALIETREDDDLTTREFRQRAGSLDADVEDVNERLDRASVAATDLSPDLREENDIDRDRFVELGERIADMQAFVAQPGRSVDSVDGDGAETEAPAFTPADPPVEESPIPETTPTEEPEDEETPTEEPETPEPTETEPAEEDSGEDGGDEGDSGEGDSAEGGSDGDEASGDGDSGMGVHFG